MTIKTVAYGSQSLFCQEDCIVLKSNKYGVTIALPFHEDTPNLHFSVAEAMELRNAIDEVLKIKYLAAPKGDF